jgi:hypothetical protein
VKFPNLEKILTAFDQSGNDAERKNFRALMRGDFDQNDFFILNLIFSGPPILKSRRNGPCRVACFLL